MGIANCNAVVGTFFFQPNLQQSSSNTQQWTTAMEAVVNMQILDRPQGGGRRVARLAQPRRQRQGLTRPHCLAETLSLRIQEGHHQRLFVPARPCDANRNMQSICSPIGVQIPPSPFLSGNRLVGFQRPTLGENALPRTRRNEFNQSSTLRALMRATDCERPIGVEMEAPNTTVSRSSPSSPARLSSLCRKRRLCPVSRLALTVCATGSQLS